MFAACWYGLEIELRFLHLMFKDHPDLVTLALQPPDCPQAVTEGTDIFSFEDPAVKSALLVQAFWGDW